MKVFLSWSGAQSGKFAKAFNDWLPSVFQSVVPFYSPEDIAAGERWLERLSTVLEEYQFGIVCLTTENLTAPWVMFESGALAKKLGQSKLVPVLCGVAERDLSKNPLTQFQYVHTDEAGIRKLVASINASLGDAKLSDTQLGKAFDKWWPDLRDDMAKVLAEKAPPAKKKINMDDAVEEILSILRALARRDEDGKLWHNAVREVLPRKTSSAGVATNTPTLEQVAEILGLDLAVSKGRVPIYGPGSVKKPE